MRNAQGYATITDPETGVRECDTATCAHCNSVVHIPAGIKFEQVGDFCRSCMKVICARCAQNRSCTPFEKQLELMEARYHARRSYEG